MNATQQIESSTPNLTQRLQAIRAQRESKTQAGVEVVRALGELQNVANEYLALKAAVGDQEAAAEGLFLYSKIVQVRADMAQRVKEAK